MSASTKALYSSAPTPLFCEDDVIKHFNFLYSGEQNSIECRIIGYQDRGRKCNGVGYFDNVFDMVKFSRMYHSKAHVYVGLNPRPHEKLHAQPANTIVFGVDGCKDSEIRVRKHLLIDLDPRRATTDVASTEQELEYARRCCEEIEMYLMERGVVPAIKAMSGNGYHLICKITDPHPSKKFDSKTDQLALLLKHLARKFDNEKVCVDVGNANPGRLVKLYGTASVKGGNTIERPWRTSKIEVLNG